VEQLSKIVPRKAAQKIVDYLDSAAVNSRPRS
jgi:hypothetical protein